MYEILTNRSFVEIKGNDSLKFLQNLITNDLISDCRFLHCYMLNSVGRYLFDFFIFKVSNEHFLIDISKSSCSNFISKLHFYKLRAQVEIQDVSEKFRVIYINLIHSKELDVSVCSEFLSDTGGLIYMIQDPRFSLMGLRLLVSSGYDNFANLGQKTEYLYIEDKYKYSIPDGNCDLIYEKSYIMEFGAKELNSINYNKGCYIGQEVVSRTEYLGVVRKKLYKITSDENIDDLKNHDITNEQGEKLGVCTSSYKNLGIGLLKLDDENDVKNLKLFLNNKQIWAAMPSWRIS